MDVFNAYVNSGITGGIDLDAIKQADLPSRVLTKALRPRLSVVSVCF
jgi:hypothetical protein